MNSLSFAIPGTGWISVLSLWRKWKHIKYGLPVLMFCISSPWCYGAKGCLQYKKTPWVLIASETIEDIVSSPCFITHCIATVYVSKERNRAVQNKI